MMIITANVKKVAQSNTPKLFLIIYILYRKKMLKANHGFAAKKIREISFESHQDLEDRCLPDPPKRMLLDISNWKKERTSFGHQLVSPRGDILINADNVIVLQGLIEKLKAS